MQQATDQTKSQPVRSITINWNVVRVVAAIASVQVTLVAIFLLDAWAAASGWHHAAQHVMIFGSGAVAGVSLLGTRKNKRES